MVLIRRFDAEATALQRQGELGLWASLLGQEAAQIGSGRAARPRRLRLPDLPRARRRLVPRRRPAEPARHVPRRQPTAAGTRTRTTSTSTRSSSARRRCTPPATPWACAKERRRTPAVHRLLRRRRLQPGRRRTRRSSSPPSTTRPSCSSARTTSGPSPSRPRSSPACRSTSARPGYGFPGVRVDGNDVLAVPRRHPGGAGARPQRAGPDARSRRSPTGWARTPPPTTRPATAPTRSEWRGRRRTRSRRLRAVPATREGLADDGVLRRGRGGGRRRWPGGCATACRAMPDPDRLAIFDHVYAGGAPAGRRGARAVRGLPGIVRRGRPQDWASEP